MKMQRVERFARAYECDPEWVQAQAGTQVMVLAGGEQMLLASPDGAGLLAPVEVVRHVRNERYLVTQDGVEKVVSADLLKPRAGYHADPRWQKTLARLRDEPEELLKVPRHMWTSELVYAAVHESGCFNAELASPVARAAIANGALDADVAWALARTDPIWLEGWLTSADQLNTVDLEALTAAVDRIREFALFNAEEGTLDSEMLNEYFGVLSAIRDVVPLDVDSQALLEGVFYLAPALFDKGHPVSNRRCAPIQVVAALAARAIRGAMALNLLTEERQTLMTDICLNCQSMFSDRDAAPLLWQALAESEAIALLSRVAEQGASKTLRVSIEQGLSVGADACEVDKALAANPGIVGPLLRLGARLSTEQVLEAASASGLSAEALAEALFKDGQALHPAAKEACWAAYDRVDGDAAAPRSPSM